MKSRLGGHILVDQLLANGCDIAFGVPGESYLAVLDGFYERRDRTRFVISRHEGGAAVMAETYGKLTGRPGVCFVTRGPGACNASIGVHTAFQDSTPMLLFIGQVGSDFADREAFQEVDYRKMYAPLAKWVEQIDRADRIPEYISRAYHIAMSGRPGPVVLALPEDMLTGRAEVVDAPAAQRVITYASPAQVQDVAQRIARAKSPIVVVGGHGWSPASCDALAQFAQTANVPIATTFRFQDLMDNLHPQYAGDVGIGINPALAKRIKEADLVVAIGPRLGEMTTSGYTLFECPRPQQTLVHVHAGANELGRVYQADVLINATPGPFAEALAALAPRVSTAVPSPAHSEYLHYSSPVRRTPEDVVDLAEIVGSLNRLLPRDAILTNGAGNYAAFLHRYYRYGGFRTQLAPTSGAMGHGVPAAVAAKLIDPKRTVVSWNGDGCFQMNGLEIGTAMQYGASVIFVVVNNGTYGTIRMHQERDYPSRISGTDLYNPNFAAFAQSFGANGVQTRTLAEFEAAMKAALTADKASLIEIITDAEYISPRATITQLRAAKK
jgi:acetolactate synthase-1/2/3 large subunit